MSSQQVLLQLQRVKCLDETGGSWAEHMGNDEIALGGVGIDASGNTVKLAPFTVYANFDDGETKEYSPPKTLMTLNVPSEGTFPKTVAATLILTEVDSDDVAGYVEDAFNEVSGKMQERKQEMMNAGASPYDVDWSDVPEPVKKGIVDWLVSKIPGLSDDVFPPIEIGLDVTSSDHYWGDGTKLSPEETINFHGHDGSYYLTYFWEIQNVATA